MNKYLEKYSKSEKDTSQDLERREGCETDPRYSHLYGPLTYTCDIYHRHGLRHDKSESCISERRIKGVNSLISKLRYLNTHET
jgi:hypothetical protein